MKLPKPSTMYAEDPYGLLALLLVGGTALIWGVLFVLTGFFDTREGSWGHALSFSVGTVDPFTAGGGFGQACAISLAVVSWLLVPVLLGSAAALFSVKAVQKARPNSEEKLPADTRNILLAKETPQEPDD